jgi:conjugal transfer pilus assembly protein TraK
VPVRRLAGGGLEFALWREARFVQVARYDVPGLVGEAYELTNISGQRMVIDERELYRPGVVSVSLRALQLAPGASTEVWIVRQADGRD